ncbi:hypothetical protein MANES_11G160600v8 [Manihot esculenta]|uniref:Uncharacterized protein n=1 Tax=Manihot esculenta TaxID=3983 RepID=A0ACB7GWJ3_MANES|nr:hypothetical protein MANES_11G160600v8 [Manihot esculenta]
MAKLNLDGKEIKPLKICVIGDGDFIGACLCEKIIYDSPHQVTLMDESHKIKHLFGGNAARIDRFSYLNIDVPADVARLQPVLDAADILINIPAVCLPADYSTRTFDTIKSNFLDVVPLIEYCSEKNKRLIHLSSSEVYGKTTAGYLLKDDPLRKDPKFYVLKEDESPCILGSIDKRRWSYACAQQLTERLISAEGDEHGLEYTIVRAFNWVGPRMDFIPGVDGPCNGVPTVLTSFSNSLLRREPLKLVDGGYYLRTFCFIEDAMVALLLMIDNPERANGQIFNVGNPNTEISIKELANLMIRVHAKFNREPRSNYSTVAVSSEVFYGKGYDDCDRRIPDMTIINRQLGKY